MIDIDALRSRDWRRGGGRRNASTCVRPFIIHRHNRARDDRLRHFPRV